MSEFEIYEIVNILGLLIGITFGAIAQKKQFCFSGSIKDYILTKSTKRASSVLMAMITAIISTTIVANYYDIDLTYSNYYRENINYFSIIIGGLLFGAGMMIADGCGNRHLVKFAQGDSNSLIALVFIGIFAFATANGLLNDFFSPITKNETLLSWSAILGNITMNVYIVEGILAILLAFVIKKSKRDFSIIDGFLIGLLIAASWYVTGVMGEESIERLIDLNGITFIYPTAKTFELFSFYQVNPLTFSIAVVIGVVLGAFIMSKFNKKYSFGCTASQGGNRAKSNMIGGALMGSGGVLSIGCTVGQGLTGLSTLAFASAIAIISIFISAVVTAIILNKKDKLPMCFIFEWEDNNPDYQI